MTALEMKGVFDDYNEGLITANQRTQRLAKSTGVLAGAIAGFKIGAVAGAGTGPGAIITGIIGGIIGGFAGGFVGESAGKMVVGGDAERALDDDSQEARRKGIQAEIKKRQGRVVREMTKGSDFAGQGGERILFERMKEEAMKTKEGKDAWEKMTDAQTKLAKAVSNTADESEVQKNEWVQSYGNTRAIEEEYRQSLLNLRIATGMAEENALFNIAKEQQFASKLFTIKAKREAAEVALEAAIQERVAAERAILDPLVEAQRKMDIISKLPLPEGKAGERVGMQIAFAKARVDQRFMGAERKVADSQVKGFEEQEFLERLRIEQNEKKEGGPSLSEINKNLEASRERQTVAVENQTKHVRELFTWIAQTEHNLLKEKVEAEQAVIDANKKLLQEQDKYMTRISQMSSEIHKLTGGGDKKFTKEGGRRFETRVKEIGDAINAGKNLEALKMMENLKQGDAFKRLSAFAGPDIIEKILEGRMGISRDDITSSREMGMEDMLMGKMPENWGDLPWNSWGPFSNKTRAIIDDAGTVSRYKGSEPFKAQEAVEDAEKRVADADKDLELLREQAQEMLEQLPKDMQQVAQDVINWSEMIKNAGEQIESVGEAGNFFSTQLDIIAGSIDPETMAAKFRRLDESISNLPNLAATLQTIDGILQKMLSGPLAWLNASGSTVDNSPNYKPKAAVHSSSYDHR